MCLGGSRPAQQQQAAAPSPAPAAPPPVLQTSVNEEQKNGGLSASNRKGIKDLTITRNQVALGGMGGGTGLNIPSA